MRPIDADSFERDLKEKLLPLLVEKYGKEEAMKGLHFSLQDCISNIQGQPTITQSEQRWIPVTERLPEENEYVLLCNRELEPDEEAGYSRMAVGWLEDRKFCCWDDRAARKEFVAWMPLPEPYKEGEQK